ncbi:MAG: MFS transporter [Lachnospiraceae bacterium]|nr:MFS transporter [Lachnospiraceae bacterium]
MKKYNRTKIACYLGFITQAITANFMPLLFLTFHRDYGISLERLAMISAVFFITQLIVDLLCVKLADKIGYRKSIIIAEIMAGSGLILLSFLPDIMPDRYAGLLICTIIYAIGSGLIEVLCSPIIEACPFENKAGMMSLLHSFYCWGSVAVVLISTVFFNLAGIGRWRIMALLWALVPLFNVINFAVCPILPINEEGGEGMKLTELLKNKLFWLFVVLMICAGACEIAMAQWASTFVESALGVSKSIGDLAGPCLFAVFMGISRIFYSKYGEKWDLTLFMLISGVLCLISYLLAALSDLSIMGLAGCVLCGFSVGIMWPGSISISSKKLEGAGTALFAFLALAGDCGGAAGPALVGAVSQRCADDLKMGILAGTIFPVILIICSLILLRYKTRSEGKLK